MFASIHFAMHSGFSSRRWAAALAFFCVGSAAAVTPPTTPVEPRYEIVEAMGATDVVSDIAVDPAGLRPALAYYDSTRADRDVPSQVPVKLARYDRFARVITTMGFVNGRTGNNRDLRLAIDETGRAHAIALEVGTIDIGQDDALVYLGTDAQGAPIREQIDIDNVSQITLAVDAAEEPYVAYIKTTGTSPNFLRTLVVRRRAGGAWQQITLDTTPTNASSPSFAPYPVDATFFPMHLAWAESGPAGSAIRHATVSTQTATTDTVVSSPITFTLFTPQIVVDRFGTLEVVYTSTPDPQVPANTTWELRRRAFNESTWLCIDTGCTLPTGPLVPRQSILTHAYVSGSIVVQGNNGFSTIVRREGANWVSYLLSNLATAQGSALDRFGNVYTAGVDRSTHRDLFMVRIAGPWEIKSRVPFDGNTFLSHPLDVVSDGQAHPIVYARRSCCSGDPRGSLWIGGTGNDFIEHALPGSFTAEQASIAYAPDGTIHVAIYDSDQDDLVHAEFVPGTGGGTWNIVRVDTLGDVGASPTMLIGFNGTPMIVYRRRPDLLHLATRTEAGTWMIKGLATGVLDAARPAAVVNRDAYIVHVSWFDEQAQRLRVTTLRGDPLVQTNVLSTEFVPNPAGWVRGRVHDLAMMGDGGVAIAASDETNGQTRLGYRYRDQNGSWFDGDSPESFGVPGITRISLDTTLLSPGGARVAWIVGGRLHYGEKHIGFNPWDTEDLGAIGPDAPMHLGAAGPLRISYNEGNGLFVLQRLEPLSGNHGLSDVIGRLDSTSGPGICVCFIEFGNSHITGSCFSEPEPQATAPRFDGVQSSIASGNGQPPSADDVLRHMRDLFRTTPAGRYYLKLFSEHAAEIIRLTLASPSMIVQRSSTFSDLMPGMAALVESPAEGAQYRFTQDLMSNAVSVVQGWRSAGSPALRAAIDNEFARTAFFSQYTGMTFTEWFNAISVGNATENLFEDGFE